MDNINWNKVAEQEPEFVEFCKMALWTFTLNTVDKDFIKSMYSFYQIGMTSEQVSQWMSLNNRMNRPPEGKSNDMA